MKNEKVEDVWFHALEHLESPTQWPLQTTSQSYLEYISR
jgi:hypothetical protein